MMRETQSLIKSEIIVDKFGVVSEMYELSPSTWLEGAIINGVQYGTIINDVSDERELPSKFELQQNHPNPFNPTTTIKYSILKNGNVNLTIYNVLGQKWQRL